MISKQQCWVDSKGKAYQSLQKCQSAEILTFFTQDSPEIKDDSPWTVEEIANRIVEKSEAIVNILTTTEGSRPKARKLNGATRKPRTPKAKPEMEDPFSAKAHPA